MSEPIPMEKYRKPKKDRGGPNDSSNGGLDYALERGMPDEFMEWLRMRAAMETIKRRTYISIDSLLAEVFIPG